LLLFICCFYFFQPIAEGTTFLSLTDKCARLKETLSTSYANEYKHILKASKPELATANIFDLKVRRIEEKGERKEERREERGKERGRGEERRGLFFIIKNS
jgi:hypothetical protein